MSRIAGVCCVYEDDVWLRAMVEGCYPALDRLYFLVGARPWCGVGGSNARAIEAIRASADPHRKIVVVEGDWPTEAIQRNAGLERCAREGFTHSLMIDSDEVYDPQFLRVMFQIARAQNEIAVWRVHWYTYWKTYRYRIDPPENFPPVVLMQVGGVQFVKNRLVSTPSMGCFAPSLGMCHHLSYARSDDEVKAKLEHFSLADQIRQEWFETVWKRWDTHRKMENLHPVRPAQYRRAIVQDPAAYPPVLRRLYDSEPHAREDAPMNVGAK